MDCTTSAQYGNTRKAAEYCGFSPSFLEKLRIYGGGPAYSKLGRAVLYKFSDLDEWIAAARCSNTAENPQPPNDN